MTSLPDPSSVHPPIPADLGASEAQASATRLSRAGRWAVAVGVATMAGIGMVLLFLLTLATNNRALYERYYGWLFGVNVLVAAVLLLVLVWIGARLARRLYAGRFGSRLLFKLATIFGLVGLLPGLLIYVVSYQFVSRSIESWFDVKVEGALSAGVNLARVTLDTLTQDIASKTRYATTQLTQVPNTSAGVALDRLREELGANDVVLWSASGQMLASAGASRFSLTQERPSAQLMRALREQRVVAQIEGLDDIDAAGKDAAAAAAQTTLVKAVALVPSKGVGLLEEPRFLQVTVPLPPLLVANAIAVQEANREYQERALGREGLRRMYIGTLTLSLFLAVMGAVLLAVLLGKQLARPLLVLAEGVREVAAGNLRPKSVLQTNDELSGLTRSFAVMTQQLSDARSAVQQSLGAVDAARANLQTILDNLTAGVIVLDEQGNVISSNPGAARILHLDLQQMQGRKLATAAGLEAFAQAVQTQFELVLGDGAAEVSDLGVPLAASQSGNSLVSAPFTGVDHWQHQFELSLGGQGSHGEPMGINIVARGALLPDSYRLLVLDDITEIVSAQRSQAWGEVARRVAHEIKNPLTPIQLSAERMEIKLSGKLPPAEQAILTKSVKTIVDQVAAMKHLVNEFRDYARLPAADLHPLDLNGLVQDVLQLYGAENARIPVVAQLDPLCPLILGDAQQLRQVVHNLLQNAQDATQQAADKDLKQVQPVRIITRWSESGLRVRLTVTDSGVGFPSHILQRAFEPYVTTKSKGTGLGLAVVKKIMDEHGARIDITNWSEGGCVLGAQVSLSFAVEQIAT